MLAQRIHDKAAAALRLLCSQSPEPAHCSCFPFSRLELDTSLPGPHASGGTCQALQGTTTPALHGSEVRGRPPSPSPSAGVELTATNSSLRKLSHIVPNPRTFSLGNRLRVPLTGSPLPLCSVCLVWNPSVPEIYLLGLDRSLLDVENTQLTLWGTLH